jgi:hypothetical protein
MEGNQDEKVDKLKTTTIAFSSVLYYTYSMSPPLCKGFWKYQQIFAGNAYTVCTEVRPRTVDKSWHQTSSLEPHVLEGISSANSFRLLLLRRTY